MRLLPRGKREKGGWGVVSSQKGCAQLILNSFYFYFFVFFFVFSLFLFRVALLRTKKSTKRRGKGTSTTRLSATKAKRKGKRIRLVIIPSLSPFNLLKEKSGNKEREKRRKKIVLPFRYFV